MQVFLAPASVFSQLTSLSRVRAIKCDESKPTCLRCHRSNRTCSGYKPKADLLATQKILESSKASISGSESSSTPGRVSQLCFLGPPLSNAMWQGEGRARLVGLGCWVLGNDPYREDHGLDAAVWSRMLPCLSQTVPLVNAAVAVLGASYKERFLDGNDPTGETSVIYSLALRNLSHDLLDQRSEPEPLILACVVLACAEALCGRPLNALAHLKGARSLLNARPRPGQALMPVERPFSSAGGQQVDAEYDLALLIGSMDLQGSAYAISASAELAGADDDRRVPVQSKFDTVGGAERSLLKYLRDCYRFTAAASKLKYMPLASIVRETSIEQGRHISRLSLWLKTLDDNVLGRRRNTQELHVPSYRHAYMLRAQCLIAIIYVSTILSPYEVEYDRHAAFFQDIVENVTFVLAKAVKDDENTTSSQFRPGLGIIQPLLFTALKYRHSDWRRKAITLLEHVGMEGPWSGRVEARLAERAMQVEEEDLALKGVPGAVLKTTPEQICERKRVCGISIVGPRLVRDSSGITVISISRCVDVDFMVSGEDHFESPKHWNVWQETMLIVDGLTKAR